MNDKRNTYIQLTPKGEDVFLKILESYDPTRNAVLKGAQPLHQLYGKFPEIVEMMSIIRHIYGDDFMEIFEKSFSNIESEFTSEEGKMKKKQEAKEAGESIEMDKPLEPLKN